MYQNMIAILVLLYGVCQLSIKKGALFHSPISILDQVYEEIAQNYKELIVIVTV